MYTHKEYVKEVTIIIMDQLGYTEYDDINPDTPLRQQGADSLDDIELIMAFENEFDMDIHDEEAEKLTTVNLIVEFLENRLGVDEG